MKKHWTHYLPKSLTLHPVVCIVYVWRNEGWTLRETVDMWRESGRTFKPGGIDFLGQPRDRVGEFFVLNARRALEASENYACIYGCCTVIWRNGKNQGGMGPAGCPCDDMDDPRDLARGPLVAK
jgi:hypothetical protein